MCYHIHSHYGPHIFRSACSKHRGCTCFSPLSCVTFGSLFTQASHSLAVSRRYASKVYLDFFQIMFQYMFILGQISLNLELSSSPSNSNWKFPQTYQYFSFIHCKNNVIPNVSNHVVLFFYKSSMQTQWINKQSVGRFMAMKGV